MTGGNRLDVLRTKGQAHSPFTNRFPSDAIPARGPLFITCVHILGQQQVWKACTWYLTCCRGLGCPHFFLFRLQFQQPVRVRSLLGLEAPRLDSSYPPRRNNCLVLLPGMVLTDTLSRREGRDEILTILSFSCVVHLLGRRSGSKNAVGPRTGEGCNAPEDPRPPLFTLVGPQCGLIRPGGRGRPPFASVS